MESNVRQDIAEQISQLLKNSEAGSRDDFLRASLEKINSRLDSIESQLSAAPAVTSATTFNHVSQERFKSLEEIADQIIAGLNGEKDCPYEPAAKPCDNCSMCSSRGF